MTAPMTVPASAVVTTLNTPSKATAHEYAGLRLTRRARVTGTQVSLYDGDESGMDTDGGRWSTVCEPHGGIVNHTTYALALEWLSHPDEWCPTCRGEVPDPHAGRNT